MQREVEGGEDVESGGGLGKVGGEMKGDEGGERVRSSREVEM